MRFVKKLLMICEMLVKNQELFPWNEGKSQNRVQTAVLTRYTSKKIEKARIFFMEIREKN